MTPADIEKLFQPVFSQAKELKELFEKSKLRAQESSIVDEVDQLARRNSAGRHTIGSIVGSVMTHTASVPSHGDQALNPDHDEKQTVDFSHKMPFVTVSSHNSCYCEYSHNSYCFSVCCGLVDKALSSNV